MTMQELANRYGITRQGLYQRLKRHGITLDELRNESGEITIGGLKKIHEIFGDPLDDNAQPSTVDVNEPVNVDAKHDNIDTESVNVDADRFIEVDALRQQVTALKAEVMQLRSDAERLQALLDAVTNERDHLRTLMEKEQAISAAALMTVKQLPASPADAERKRGFFARLFGR